MTETAKSIDNSMAATAIAQAVSQAAGAASLQGKMVADIDYIKSSISDIKLSIQSILKEFVERREFEERIKSLEIHIGVIEKSTTMQKIVTPVISAVLSSVFTFLIISYLSHK